MESTPEADINSIDSTMMEVGEMSATLGDLKSLKVEKTSGFSGSNNDKQQQQQGNILMHQTVAKFQQDNDYDEDVDEDEDADKDITESPKKVVRKKSTNTVLKTYKVDGNIVDDEEDDEVFAVRNKSKVSVQLPPPIISFSRKSLSSQDLEDPVSSGTSRHLVRGNDGILCPGYTQYSKSLLEVPLPRDYGYASSDDLSSEWESDAATNAVPSLALDQKIKKASGWRKIRNIVHWTPFFQTYKKQRYPWVQLAGHQGNFKAGTEQGTVLKKFCPKEMECFQLLMRDILRPYVPEYRGEITSEDGELYLQLEDLLSDFQQPCVMDCKIGVRTYLEEELSKAKEKPKLRKDMYDKMVQIDPNAPSEEEHQAKGVTKPRYMVWRETISSTATLGFRIEGIKKSDGSSSKDFKTTKSREQIKHIFYDFISSFPHALARYLQRLHAIRATLEYSNFFCSHEMIGSSLLFVHDHRCANVWMIDFAKTTPLPDNLQIDHFTKWTVGNHEDGYLIGIDNLIDIFSELIAELKGDGGGDAVIAAEAEEEDAVTWTTVTASTTGSASSIYYSASSRDASEVYLSVSSATGTTCCSITADGTSTAFLRSAKATTAITSATGATTSKTAAASAASIASKTLKASETAVTSGTTSVTSKTLAAPKTVPMSGTHITSKTFVRPEAFPASAIRVTPETPKTAETFTASGILITPEVFAGSELRVPIESLKTPETFTASGILITPEVFTGSELRVPTESQKTPETFTASGILITPEVFTGSELRVPSETPVTTETSVTPQTLSTAETLTMALIPALPSTSYSPVSTTLATSLPSDLNRIGLNMPQLKLPSADGVGLGLTDARHTPTNMFKEMYKQLDLSLMNIFNETNSTNPILDIDDVD